jgi:UDP:flavonoid glycosyltransferase YjiC (YdhE family)
MTRIVIAAFGTYGDVAPLTGLGSQLRDRLAAEVIIAAQRPYEHIITAAGLQYRCLPGDTRADTRQSAVVDGARMRPSPRASLKSWVSAPRSATDRPGPPNRSCERIDWRKAASGGFNTY